MSSTILWVLKTTNVNNFIKLTDTHLSVYCLKTGFKYNTGATAVINTTYLSAIRHMELLYVCIKTNFRI